MVCNDLWSLPTATLSCVSGVHSYDKGTDRQWQPKVDPLLRLQSSGMRFSQGLVHISTLGYTPQGSVFTSATFTNLTAHICFGLRSED